MSLDLSDLFQHKITHDGFSVSSPCPALTPIWPNRKHMRLRDTTGLKDGRCRKPPRAPWSGSHYIFTHAHAHTCMNTHVSSPQSQQRSALPCPSQYLSQVERATPRPALPVPPATAPEESGQAHVDSINSPRPPDTPAAPPPCGTAPWAPACLPLPAVVSLTGVGPKCKFSQSTIFPKTGSAPK